MRAELILGAAQRAGASATAGPANNAFLQQRLSYDGEKLLDADARGVMMAWEGETSDFTPPPWAPHVLYVHFSCITFI